MVPVAARTAPDLCRTRDQGSAPAPVQHSRGVRPRTGDSHADRAPKHVNQDMSPTCQRSAQTRFSCRAGSRQRNSCRQAVRRTAGLPGGGASRVRSRVSKGGPTGSATWAAALAPGVAPALLQGPCARNCATRPASSCRHIQDLPLLVVGNPAAGRAGHQWGPPPARAFPRPMNLRSCAIQVRVQTPPVPGRWNMHAYSPVRQAPRPLTGARTQISQCCSADQLRGNGDSPTGTGRRECRPGAVLAGRCPAARCPAWAAAPAPTPRPAASTIAPSRAPTGAAPGCPPSAPDRSR